MRLESEFYRLPLTFDVKRLNKEIDAFVESDWCPHPQGFAGNSALLLISANGDAADDGMMGPMLPTPLLEKSPYLKQVLTSFGTVFGRTRLMRLEGNYEANLHMDASYYWHQRMRVHVPIRTHPEVEFLCADKKVHMAAGESWIFDTWKKHNVINPINKTRIHLVADTVGSARFQRLINNSWAPFSHTNETKHTDFIEFDNTKNHFLQTEKVNFPVIMTPWEQQSLLQPMIDELMSMQSPESLELISTIRMFMLRWKATWHIYGDSQESEPQYQNILDIFVKLLDQLSNKLIFTNNMEAVGLIKHAVFYSALNPHLRYIYKGKINKQTELKTQIDVVSDSKVRHRTPIFGEAIFIIAAPRSGSSLLFETLSQSPDLYTIGGESHHLIESIEQLTPKSNNFKSNRLTEIHATDYVVGEIRQHFMHQLHDRHGNKIKANMPPIKMLEKTPKNSLRIRFLNKIFPNARFIYLTRNPKENISSIIDAWKSSKFITYKDLPNRSKPWSLLLTPNWNKQPEEDIAITAAHQWQQCHETILSDFNNIDSTRISTVSYEDLISNPQVIIDKLCQFCKISWDTKLTKNLPIARHTLSTPNRNKWKRNADELHRVLPNIKTTYDKVLNFIEKTQ